MKAWTGLLTLGLAGCSLTPDYQAPALPVAAHWRDHPTEIEAKALSEWHEVFSDPQLYALITQALQHNRNLQVAILRIEEARAQHGIQRAGQWPAVGLNGSTERKQVSALDSPDGQRHILERGQVGLGITAFELDLWGRLAALKDAAGHSFVATQEDARSVQISLIAEVASHYYKALALLKMRDQHQQLLTMAHAARRMMTTRYEAGLVSELQDRQADSWLQNLQRQSAETDRELNLTLHNLEYLAGNPLDQSRLLSAAWRDGSVILPVSPGLASQLLTRRPDIRAAEARLRALDANIGAARSAFLPSISLTALLGFSSPQLGQLFSGDARSWSFSPQLGVPLFDMGKRLAQLDVAKAQRESAVAHYQLTVQQAFREVADALGSAEPLQIRLDAQERTVANELRRVELANLLLNEGLNSYLEVVDAQRRLSSAQQDLITVRLLQINNRISLYKSLGGGWS